MAVEICVPVIPIHIRGTYEVLPINQDIPRRRCVHIFVGKALYFPYKTPYIEATGIFEYSVKVLEGLRVE
jgi:hypothetical protein